MRAVVIVGVCVLEMREESIAMDSRHDHRTESDAIDSLATSTEAELRAVLAESVGNMAAGRIIPGDVILRELHEAATRIEARRAARRP